jgi:hypothetical protein
LGQLRFCTLKDNPMDARKESCPTRTILLLAWHNAADAYAKAVAELSRKIGILPKAEYEKLSQAAETARKRSREAQVNLETHIADHGCNGTELAA